MRTKIDTSMNNGRKEQVHAGRVRELGGTWAVPAPFSMASQEHRMRAWGSQLSSPDIGTAKTPRIQTLELQTQKEENLGSQLEGGLGLELRGWSAGLMGEKPGFSTAHTGVVLCAWDPSTREAEAGASGMHA